MYLGPAGEGGWGGGGGWGGEGGAEAGSQMHVEKYGSRLDQKLHTRIAMQKGVASCVGCRLNLHGYCLHACDIDGRVTFVFIQ